MPGIIMPSVDSVKKEPVIAVGIILTEDQRTSIKLIAHHDPNESKIDVVSGEMEFQVYNDKINLNGKLYEEIHLSPDSQEDVLTIVSVPAGRGFHWEKNINIKVSGAIHIKNIDGYLTLINYLPLENYLECVATAEMNSNCPFSFLEAQVIAARSWLLVNRGTKHKGFDVCNDDCCQRYQGIKDSVSDSIKNTYGKVIAYNNVICDARYSKCCGGITELFENVWQGSSKFFLSSIFDGPNKTEMEVELEKHITTVPKAYCSPHYLKDVDIKTYLGDVDTEQSYFRWQLEYSSNQLIVIIKKKVQLDLKHISDIIPLKRGSSGRITKLQIKFIDQNNDIRSKVLNSEYEIRNALHNKFLFSSAFLIEKKFNDQHLIENIKFRGAGWGHGVGMCQMGALGMALDGYNHQSILEHYFAESKIVKLY